MNAQWFQVIGKDGRWYGSSSRYEDDAEEGPGARSDARDAARVYSMPMTLQSEDAAGVKGLPLETWFPDGRCESAVQAQA